MRVGGFLLKKLSIRFIAVLATNIFLFACVAAGNAVTFAWLSGFPERATTIPALQRKFWIWVVVSICLAIFDVVLFVALLLRRQLNSRDKKNL